MATFTLTVFAPPLFAENDSFSTSNKVDEQIIDVLANDLLGVEPTIISSVNTTGFTLGTVTINVDEDALLYNPSGTIGTSSITYTIMDDNGNTSTATVTITQT